MSGRIGWYLGCASGLFCAFILLAAGGSQANAPPPTPIHLVAAYGSKNPNNPPWCNSEDDWYQREWSGTLNGTFTATEYYCDRQVDFYNGNYWGGSGQGFVLYIDVVGTLSSASVSSPGSAGYPSAPGGTWEPPATFDVELIASQPLGNGKNAKVRNTYAACAMPNSLVYPRQTLPGGGDTGDELMGTWTATLTGDFSYADVLVIHNQDIAPENTTYCPADMQTRDHQLG